MLPVREHIRSIHSPPRRASRTFSDAPSPLKCASCGGRRIAALFFASKLALFSLCAAFENIKSERASSHARRARQQKFDSFDGGDCDGGGAAVIRPLCARASCCRRRRRRCCDDATTIMPPLARRKWRHERRLCARARSKVAAAPLKTTTRKL